MKIYRVGVLTALFGCPIFAATPQISPASLPHVRGLEYRAVILTQNSKPPFSHPAQPAHLWVVPAHDGQAVSALGWDGVNYDVLRVGSPADWRADVRAALVPHIDGEIYTMPQPFEFSPTPLSLALLKELNAPDFYARALAAVKARSFGRSVDALATYQINLRDAGVRSFTSRNFVQAKRQLQTLLAVSRVKTTVSPTKRRIYITDWSGEATEILADIERRTHPAPRPKDTIAALILDLQNVRAFQMSSPGNINWTQDPTVRNLIDRGDVAVEPLLDTLENDPRLTLSVRLSRGFPSTRVGSIGTVREAALAALENLLHHDYYGPNNWNLTPQQRNAAIAAEIRADWLQSKGRSPVERVFNTLSNSGETPQHLEEAAQQLVQIGPAYNQSYIRLQDGTLRPDTPSQTFFGEPLRSRHNPSISDLLEARIKELSTQALNGKQAPQAFNPAAPDLIKAPTSDPYALNRTMRAANTLSWYYAKWDSKRATPLLGAQLELTKRYVASLPRGIAEDGQSSLSVARHHFLSARLHTPFRAEALREYAAYLQSAHFGRLPQDEYSILWLYPNEPAVVRATHALFDSPHKPFQEAAQWKTSDFDYEGAFRLLHSPLLKIPAFKAAVIRELGNPTPIGTLRATKKGEAEISVTAWDWSGETVTLTGPNLEHGKSQTVRVCDLVGFWLYENRPNKSGQDRYYPQLDVSLPTPQRDTKLRRIKTLVKTGRVVSDGFSFEIPDF